MWNSFPNALQCRSGHLDSGIWERGSHSRLLWLFISSTWLVNMKWEKFYLLHAGCIDGTFLECVQRIWDFWWSVCMVPRLLLIVMIKGEGEVVPVHALRAYGWRLGIAALFLNLCTRWIWWINFTPQQLYSHCHFPMNRELRWATGLVWMLYDRREMSHFCQKTVPDF